NVHWAKSFQHDGLPNFFEVTPRLYRGSQPDPDGFIALAAMGIRTIVNLRAFHQDADEIQEAGLDKATFDLEQIPMFAWNIQTKDVVRFLKIAVDPRKQPVFVHCHYGADRTGAMIAAYRMVIQQWTADQAIAEMTGGGYGFHEIWWGLPEYLKSLDVDRIRRQLTQASPLELNGSSLPLKRMLKVVSVQENLEELKAACRNKLSVLGKLNGIEMRRWSPDNAEEEVNKAIFLAGFGGGFILSDNHGEIPWQVPDDVLMAISQAVHKWGHTH
ncbi:MAG: dual specificity protein phosphatase family protein, partial [Desulfobacterales bacterium]|nr:dual specificity protein phosphatase family protein [Desulfobacterales bacterium]